MLRVEDLREERENPRAAFLQYLLNDKKNSKDIHVFVEGRADSSFYANFIHTFALDDNNIYPFYVCGDKEGVYKSHELVMNTSPQAIVLFFVDKDLSDILNELWPEASNIYVTDYYSIENSLVSTNMLLRIWTDSFHFSKIAVNFSDIYINKFTDERDHFYQFCLPIIAWNVYLRRKGKKPILKNVKFSDFFVFTEDLTLQKSENVRSLGEFKVLERICGKKLDMNWQLENPDWQLEIDRIMNELASLPPKYFIYGKLELSFFINFIEALVKFLHKGVSSRNDKAKVWQYPETRESNAVEFLGPRAIISQSLKNFLHDNISSHV